MCYDEKHLPGLNPITARYGKSLADWLNQSKGTAEHMRVCDFIASFAAVRATISGYYSHASHITEGGRLFSGRIPNEVISGDHEYERQMSRLRRKLRQYPFFLDVQFPLERQWVGSWQPLGKRAERKHYLREHDAVRWLHEISVEGELERLRKCACNCGLWFFALKLGTLFYGDHRQKPYRSSPDFKRHRAEYMRTYRGQQKERDEKALIAARRALKSKLKTNKAE